MVSFSESTPFCISYASPLLSWWLDAFGSALVVVTIWALLQGGSSNKMGPEYHGILKQIMNCGVFV